MSVMDRVICVERRTENSKRPYFNLAGDWRPRLVLWPEYEGLGKDQFEEKFPQRASEIPDEAWGRVVAEAVRDWCADAKVVPVAFRRLAHGMLTLPERLLRAVTSNPAVWEVSTQPWYRIDPERLNDWQHHGHHHVIFLLTDRALSDDEKGSLCLQPSLDRATLLPYGKAILQFGIEEAVLDICFADAADEEGFLAKLSAPAARDEHRVERTTRPFLSHWVAANRKAYGPEWDRF
jgi:hypothetical protein